jgi:CO/xanthine dehydrogenase Mo-binding subunit
VTLNLDGSVTVNSSIFEPGTGTYTVLAKIVAEELELSVDRIKIEVWDTDAVNFDTGVGGSRSTRMGGLAAYQAAGEVASDLFRIAADLLGWPEEKMSLSGDDIVQLDTGERYPWVEVLGRIGTPITGKSSYNDPNRSPITCFNAQVAEVEVDPDTGAVKLLRLTTAHDVGRILNPLDHQGQIDGAIIQGVGYALSEDLQMDEGRVSTVTFGDYKIPCIQDIPRLDTVILDSDSGPGPYNARGIGENPCACVAPAIANAVADASGARIRHLPITAEKVFHELKSR